MWSDTKVCAPTGCAPSLDPKGSLDPSTWRVDAPSHGCWVKPAPAVSILQSGTATKAFAGRLSERRARVLTVIVGGSDTTNGTTLDQNAADIQTAVLDTDVTLIEHGAASCNLAELLTAASALGYELESKPGYHVVVVLGKERTVGKTILKVAETLERTSGKHLGPDFGLCLVQDLDLSSSRRVTLSDAPRHSHTLWATDRRAGETVRVLFDVVGESVTLKPLFLQPGEPC
jgi:hypothetical protein